MCEGKQCKPVGVSGEGRHLRLYCVYLEPEGCIFKHLHLLHSQELPPEVHLYCDWLHPKTAP